MHSALVLFFNLGEVLRVARVTLLGRRLYASPLDEISTDGLTLRYGIWQLPEHELNFNHRRLYSGN